jgi:preprotein translocase subunit SecG
MIYGVVVSVHVLIAIFLIIVILIQGGRGGMGEALSGTTTQSLFGGAANTVMTKITAFGASLFMITALSLAVLSSKQGQSVIDQLPMPPEALPLPGNLPELPTATEPAPAATPDAAAIPAPSDPAQPVAPSSPAAQ